ncbi:MAG: cell division protein ZapA [Gemmatimonadetes bacterium]|nr:cell division protein ZapA [Gemmatimonadota bacterium]MCY3942847.1 cell division protein ZapA [Gemmatimonadota bacterium]
MSQSGTGGRRVVRVRIAGEEYKLRTEADHEYTLRCAELVDERMREADGQADAGTRAAAVIAALSLAADLLEQRERVSTDAERLAARLSSALAVRG